MVPTPNLGRNETMLRIFAVALLAVGMSVGLAQAKGINTGSRRAARASKRLRHAPVVSEPAVDHCCARRGNGAMAG
jgi:hypothetical protein